LKCATSLWGCQSFSHKPAAGAVLSECKLSQSLLSDIGFRRRMLSPSQPIISLDVETDSVFYWPILPIVVPTYNIDTCVHLPFYNGQPSIVSECKKLRSRTKCTYNRKCFYTTPNWIGTDTTCSNIADIVDKVDESHADYEMFATYPARKCNMRCQELDYCIYFTIKHSDGGCQLLGANAECTPGNLTGYVLYSRSDYSLPNQAMKQCTHYPLFNYEQALYK
jgi:hypothetical protein